MLETELRVERVDRLDLDAATSTGGAQVGRGHVRGTIRSEQRQCGERLQNLRPRFGALKSLQKLLENEARREQLFTVLEGLIEEEDLRNRRGAIAPQRQ